MTEDKIALRELLEKGSDATFLREMIGFAANRLMELETESRSGAGHGERTEDYREPTAAVIRQYTSPRSGPTRASLVTVRLVLSAIVGD